MRDVLEDILETLGLQGVLYFRTDFSSPWAVTVPEHECAARFHLVVQGRCHAAFSSGASVDLGPGDLVLIPWGREHVLADRSGHEAPSLESVLADAGYDGRGVLVIGEGNPEATTQMICGHFSFRRGADHPLLRALPEYLLTTAAMRAREPWLDELLRLVARRIFSEEIGSVAAVTRLSEIVFIELLRIGVSQSERLRAVLETLSDTHIHRALELIHEHPEQSWSVRELASAVGMSRSRFAERFSELMGIGPMSYLAEWRLQKALSLLEDPRCSVQQIAHRTGYNSPAAFTRAFAGKFGVPPSQYRRAVA